MKKEQIIAGMVNEVMEDFDFEKVYRVMVLTEHKWLIDGTMKVPSLYRVIKNAEELLHTCANNYGDKDNFSTSSGGFTAELDCGMLSLRYVLEEKTSYDMDYKGNF